MELNPNFNVEINWKLPFESQKYIIAQYLQSLNGSKTQQYRALKILYNKDYLTPSKVLHKDLD